MEDDKAATTRQLTDMDARITSVASRISQTEDKLEARIAAVSALNTALSILFTNSFEVCSANWNIACTVVHMHIHYATLGIRPQVISS